MKSKQKKNKTTRTVNNRPFVIIAQKTALNFGTKVDVNGVVMGYNE